VQDITEGQIFSVTGASLKALRCPGHTPDHTAFILLEEGALFTGDNVLGHGTAVFEDLPRYLASLSVMRDAPDLRGGRGYPGHGAVIDDVRARCADYLAHRALREREVVTALTSPARSSSSSSKGVAAMELVREIYSDTAESLHFAAARGVVQILEKLVAEGKVVRDEAGDGYMPTKKALL
jgi:glyoxylase-like metal-dependent hydrolase (beta-lactamase superfamily II)